MNQRQQIWSLWAYCDVFSNMDLCTGYWQVDLKPQVKENKINTDSGLYHFKVQPMDQIEAPPTKVCGGSASWRMCYYIWKPHTFKRKCCTFDHELWAVVCSVKHFKHLLSRSSLTVITDYNPPKTSSQHLTLCYNTVMSSVFPLPSPLQTEQ